MGKRFFTLVSLIIIVFIFQISSVFADPAKFLPDRCQFGPNIACNNDNFYIKNVDNDTVYLELTNNFGSNVNITNISVESDLENLDCNYIKLGDEIFDSNKEIIWNDGEKKSFFVGCVNATQLEFDDKMRFNIKYSWYNTYYGPDYMKDTEGEIFASVGGNEYFRIKKFYTILKIIVFCSAVLLISLLYQYKNKKKIGIKELGISIFVLFIVLSIIGFILFAYFGVI